MTTSSVEPTFVRARLDRALQVGLEMLVLALVVLSPWPFGSIHPREEFWLTIGIAGLVLLWIARILLRWSLAWRPCPLAACLAGLILLALWQLAPLPRDLLETVSPATARLYDRVLPAEREKIADDVTLPDHPAGATISLYPHGTRRELFRLLALFLLYLVVQNAVVSPDSLRRLSLAGLCVGGALALFGLVQFFTSTPQVMYWTFRTEGTVFGPFVCRNHFPFYINLCFGLGAGLLLSRLMKPRGFTILDLLQEAPNLWISFVLVLMATSAVFSASRGGVLALVGGGVVCLILLVRRSARVVPLIVSLLIAAGCLALLTWFGLERIQSRLGTLLDTPGLDADRLALLTRAPRLIREFPVWGTGYGSLDFVEPIYRTNPREADWIYEHAHNEYLEALIEGGFIRFALTLLAIGLVFRLGYRAWCRFEGRGTSGLILGCLFSFTTLVLHSAVDFGIHIPAIALLATVICAHLSALAQEDKAPTGTRNAGEVLSALAFRVAMLPACFFAVLLVLEGWRGADVQKLTQAAFDIRESDAIDSQLQRIAFVKAAAQLDPSNAGLHFEAAERHATLFETLSEKEQDRSSTLETVGAILMLQPGCVPVTTSGPGLALLAQVYSDERKVMIADMGRKHLTPALWHYLQARDLSPTRARTQLQIASYVEFLQQAEPRRAYLERALYLEPTHPKHWYLAGILALRDDQPELAWKDWRRSLEMSDLFLKSIVERSILRLSPQELAEQILPDRPGLYAQTAVHLYSEPDAPPRRFFLEKAKKLYEQQPGPWEAEDLLLKARVHAELGQGKAALTTYREALLQKPRDADWRFEYAAVLYREQQLIEARQELMTILTLQPNHGPARDLLTRTEREMKKGS